jgi:hypothetical protein
MNKLLLAATLAALAMASACDLSFLGLGKPDTSCSRANHCFKQDGEDFCDPGFTFAHPDVAGDFRCVSTSTAGEGEGEGEQPPAHCDAGRELCGNRCADTQNDATACGPTCQACVEGDVCSSGACVSGGDCRQQACVGITFCDLGTGHCLPGCTSTNQCGSHETCNSDTRTCDCNAGFVLCGGSCVADQDTLGDGVDSNCDGFDGNANAGAFVAVDGDDSADGSIAHPVRTIGHGIALASHKGGLVFVSKGTYSESVNVATSAELRGGFDAHAGWSHAAGNTTTIEGGTTAVLVQNVHGRVVINGFTIHAQNATAPGESSYGVRIVNSNNVDVENNVIRAGNGAQGRSRATPGAAPQGIDGPAIGDCTAPTTCPSPQEADAPQCATGFAGRGGVGGPPNETCSCPGGGRGEDGGTSFDVVTNQSISGGAGGLSRFCNHSSVQGPGASGVAGAPGHDATTSATDFGGAGSGLYAPADGAAGGDGQGGSGGGGGGSEACSTFFNTGGSGGSGGCGGVGGVGGGGGGGSFGIFASNATLVHGANVITTQNGGTGTPGTNGGAGGDGGAGGGGAHDFEFTGSAEDVGGRGGDGGAGGHGGNGGGGGGGPSIAVALVTSTETDNGDQIHTGSGGAGGTGAGGAPSGSTGRVAPKLACSGASCGTSTTGEGEGEGEGDPGTNTCGAQVLGAQSIDLDVDTSTGTTTTNGSCGGDGPELFFLWTAIGSTTVNVNTTGSAIDTVLYVFDGTCTGTELACNDDNPGGGTTSTLSFDAVDGHTYTIVVDTFSAGAGGGVHLQVQAP